MRCLSFGPGEHEPFVRPLWLVASDSAVCYKVSHRRQTATERMPVST